MPTTVSTHEAHEFSHAVADLAIDFVRMDQGFGPAVMTNACGIDAKVGVGGLDYSTVMETQAPQGFVAVQLLVANPGDVVMCGVAVDGLRPSVFAPDTPVYGRLPAGVRAVTLVADSSALHGLAADLGLRELDLHRTRVSMEATPAVQRLVVGLRDVARDPGLIEATAGDTYVLESLVRALAPEQLGGSPRA